MNDVINEVRRKYNNKESLTEDEWLYVIKNFNPDTDSPAALDAYLKEYHEYRKEIGEISSDAEYKSMFS